MKYLLEILKNDLKRQTKRKHKLLTNVVATSCNKFGQKEHGLRTVDCGLNKRTML